MSDQQNIQYGRLWKIIRGKWKAERPSSDQKPTNPPQSIRSSNFSPSARQNTSTESTTSFTTSDRVSPWSIVKEASSSHSPKGRPSVIDSVRAAVATHAPASPARRRTGLPMRTSAGRGNRSKSGPASRTAGLLSRRKAPRDAASQGDSENGVPWEYQRKSQRPSYDDEEPVSDSREVFRLRKIPDDVKYEKLEYYLETLPYPGRDTHYEKNVKMLLVVHEGSQKVAVVQFRRVPYEIKNNLKLAAPTGVYPLKPRQGLPVLPVDRHFHGVTSLFVTHPGSPVIADIIAVTGLGGHPYGSWRNSSDEMWLSDFLRHESIATDNIHVSVFGHDASLKDTSSFGHIGDWAEDLGYAIKHFRERLGVSNTNILRPIIFVAHSLGGLIVLKMLLRACHHEDFGFIAESCTALLLFGVPLQGLQNDDFLEVTRDGLNRELIEDLKEESKFLRDLVQDYDAAFRDKIRVISFFERRGTHSVKESETGVVDGTGILVRRVKESSATCLSKKPEDKIGFSLDHRQLVKFSSIVSEEYVRTRGILKECINLARQKQQKFSRESKIDQGCRDYYRKQLAAQKNYLGTLHEMLPRTIQQKSRKKDINGNSTFFWILKDADFIRWNHEDDDFDLGISYPTSVSVDGLFSALCLSSQSHFHDENGWKYIYFSCQKPWKHATASTFLCSLLTQVIVDCHPNADSRQETAESFLREVIDMGAMYLQDSSYGRRSLVDALRKIIDRLGNHVTECFMKAIGNSIEHSRLKIIVDGLHCIPRGGQQSDFCVALREVVSWLKDNTEQVRVLYTSTDPDLLKYLEDGGGMSCIRYNAEREECLASLRFENTRPQKIGSAHDQTLIWLTNNTMFKSWMKRGVSEQLYIQGKPGSGKSILARYLKDDLELHKRLVKGDILSGYFFDGGTASTEGQPAHLLQKILHDILRQKESFFFHYQKEYRMLIERGEISWSKKSFWRILESIARHPIKEHIYLILDGLDETTDPEETKSIIDKLVTIGKTDNLIIKLFVTSRPENLLDRTLRRFPTIVLQDYNKQDISIYTRAFLQELEYEIGTDLDSTRLYLEERKELILQRSQGVFLWVRLVRDEVNEYITGTMPLTKSGFDELLERLPWELEGFYERIFDALQEKSASTGYSIRMLGTVLRTYRPLTLYEFHDSLVVPWDTEDAFQVQDPSEYFNRHRIENLPSMITRHCRNVIELSGPKKSQVIQFMHQTMREYIVKRSSLPGSPFAVIGDVKFMHAHLAAICIRYMALFGGKHNSETVLEPQDWDLEHYERFCRNHLEHFRLLSYVMQHLTEHIQAAGLHLKRNQVIELQAVLRRPVIYILGNWAREQTWLFTEKLNVDLDDYIPPGTHEFKSQLLMCAASCSAITAAEICLAAGADVNGRSTRDRFANTPLMCAIAGKETSSEEEITAVVDFLLQKGAKPRMANTRGCTPLHAAAQYGRVGVAKRLVEDFGMDVNNPDKGGFTPLHLAASYGQYEAAKYLIAQGANVRAGERYGKKPIHWAAGKGCLDIVKLLIENGSPPGERDDFQTVPIHWAAGNGHYDIVDHLIYAGAYVNDHDRVFKTALRWASRFGHDDVVDLLIENNAEVNKHEYSKRTCLAWAAINGHAGCVKLLLDAGADPPIAENPGEDSAYQKVYVLTHIGRSPLAWAASYGHKEVVELLLTNTKEYPRRGPADPNFRDDIGFTPLHRAVAGGKKRLPTIKLLLEHGANPNAQNNNNETPLHFAECLNSIEIVKTLTAQGARTDIVDKDGKTPEERGKEKFREVSELEITDAKYFNRDIKYDIWSIQGTGREVGSIFS